MFLQHLVDHAGICLALHGFHGLSDQKADRFFLAALIVLHRLGIICDHFLYGLSQSSFVIDSLLAFFLYVLCRIHVVFEDLLKNLLGYGAVDLLLICHSDQCSQMLR